CRELELVQEQADALTGSETDSSDLLTAVEDDNPAERLQARLDQLTSRRHELAREAQTLLAGDLTIPTQIGSTEAHSAIDALLGTSNAGRELLKRLELQAAWLEGIDAEDSL